MEVWIMGKDLFDYDIFPTKKQFRKVNCIDKICGIPQITLFRNMILFHPEICLINDAIVNYNNEVIVAKIYYAYIEKYNKYYKKYGDEEYAFWTRKYIEQTIKELYSIYDKSMHIINYLYDFKIYPDLDFKKKVRESLRKTDEKFYKKINNVYSKLYGDKYKNIIRNDITHNFSNLFLRYVPIYNNGKKTGWKAEEAIGIDEAIKIINDICDILGDNLNIIVDKLMERFPPIKYDKGEC